MAKLKLAYRLKCIAIMAKLKLAYRLKFIAIMAKLKILNTLLNYPVYMENDYYILNAVVHPIFHSIFSSVQWVWAVIAGTGSSRGIHGMAGCHG